MNFYLKVAFLILLVIIYKILFNNQSLPSEINSLQEALNLKFLIQNEATLIINMQNVFKTRNPKQILNILIQLGGDLNEANSIGLSPLGFSIIKNDKDIIKFLLEKGADGNLELLSCILKRNYEAVVQLIDCGVDINSTGQADFTPLLFALVNCLMSGFNFEKQTFDHPIDIDAINFTYKVTALLLWHGANPNTKSNNIAALAYSMLLGDDFTKLLLSFGANPNTKFPDQAGKTFLIGTVEKNNYEMVKLILEKGADVNLQDNLGKTALFYVKDNAIAQLLINHCKNINFKGYKGHTALNWAAHKKNEELIQLLLINGADPSIKNDDGVSALDTVKLK